MGVKTEQFKESDMYGPIRDFFAGMGYEVRGEVKGCDITLVKDGELLIIEMKRGFNVTLLYQAVDRQSATTQVYVAIPRLKPKDKSLVNIMKIVRKLELGLITVAMDSAVKSVEIQCFPPASPFSPSAKNSKQNAKRREQILKEAGGRTLDLNKGGSVKRKIASAYREKAIAIACALRIQDAESRPSGLIKRFGCDEKAMYILRNNFFGWFERTGKGIYRLSEAGKAMLEGGEYPELVNYYKEKYEKIAADENNSKQREANNYLKEVNMPPAKQALPYSPDLLDSIVEDIEGLAAKNVVREIIQRFDAEGFTVKIIGEPHQHYRVLCYIKKSKETVSISIKKDHGVEESDIKIRIENRNTFDKLDEFTANVRNQILNATDCHYCGTKCDGKRYIFTYHGNEYVKCQYLGCNFRFKATDESDAASIMEIVNGELTYKRPRKK